MKNSKYLMKIFCKLGKLSFERILVNRETSSKAFLQLYDKIDSSNYGPSDWPSSKLNFYNSRTGWHYIGIG